MASTLDHAEDHQRFVRLDAAAIALLSFLAGGGVLISGQLGLGLLAFTLGFIIVGFSTVFEWRKELIKHDFVEFEPIAAVLTGGIAILILQVGFGMSYFNLQFFWALIFGLSVAFSYDMLVLIIAFFRLPGEDYKTIDHPQRDDGRQYVFETFYHISLVEEEALKRRDERNNNH